jgi:hypothetical protein
LLLLLPAPPLLLLPALLLPALLLPALLLLLAVLLLSTRLLTEHTQSRSTTRAAADTCIAEQQGIINEGYGDECQQRHASTGIRVGVSSAAWPLHKVQPSRHRNSSITAWE